MTKLSLLSLAASGQLSEPGPAPANDAAEAAEVAEAAETSEPVGGSRRRRLWELDAHAHCPVLGVCLPIALLRKVVNKALGGQAQADDYELHCGAVADAKQRTPVARALQAALDERYAQALRQSLTIKTTDALADWWARALQRQDIAGALWACLTHPRCTPELAHHIEGQVHMLQHQVGMISRIEQERLDALHHENAVLTRELAAAQQRSTRTADEQQRRIDSLQAQVMQLRAQLMTKDTQMAAQQADLQALEQAAPGLRQRHRLQAELDQLLAARHQQQRQLLLAQQEAERQRRRADDLASELQLQQQRASAAPAAVAARATDGGSAAADAQGASLSPGQRQRDEAGAPLQAQAVLCVGGRAASVPVYRRLIETTGGRFLHHDGGEEHSAAMLESTLAAADLVICQTGCISHDAYWRVKDHCKRTGKRCVFVDNPSGAGLRRALLTLVPETAPQAGSAAAARPQTPPATLGAAVLAAPLADAQPAGASGPLSAPVR